MKKKTFNDWYDACSSVFNSVTEAYKSAYLNLNDDKAKDTFLKNAQDNPHILDVNTFHKGFDIELSNLGLLNLFAIDGKLQSRNTYGIIKQLDEESSIAKALKKFWSLQFSENAKTPDEIKNALKKLETRNYQKERD